MQPPTTTPSGPPAGGRHVLVRLGARLFGIPVELVAEMVLLGPITEMPDAPPHVRGIMLVRGEAVAVKDLRGMLGMPPLPEEVASMQEMFRQREQDHRNWLDELGRSVVEGRPFTLSRDPHGCKFGKWYDQYKPSNLLLDNHLRKFDAPHRRIHALANQVDALMGAGDQEGARRLIEGARTGELNELVLLFHHLHELVASTSQEIAIVVRDARGGRLAYTVDLVESVQDLTPVPTDHGEGTLGQACAFYGPQRDIVVLLSAETLLPSRAGLLAA